MGDEIIIKCVFYEKLYFNIKLSIEGLIEATEEKKHSLLFALTSSFHIICCF